jgi:FMN phosphatase YigB (HAD superfamily)
MSSAPVPLAPPIRGIVFDFHHTLVHGGDAAAWLQTAWDDLGRGGNPRAGLGPQAYEKAVAFLDRLWEHARDVDPDNTRDLDSGRHREVFDRTVERATGIGAELSDALYRSMHLQWDTYDDTLPVLTALRDVGVRVALLSNVGYDLGAILERTKIAPLLDGTVMSFSHGVVKPDVVIFQRALDVLGLPASEVLMVGDAWRDDAAAAALGIRTLVLPRTDSPVHGLELVLRLTRST